MPEFTIDGDERVRVRPQHHGASHWVTTQQIADLASADSEDLALDGSQITSGTIADARIASSIARDSEVTSAVASEASARTAAIAAAIAALINSAPGTLDTLAEIATALGSDPNLSATLVTSIATKVAKSLYDANTIVKADSDDTPAALTVGEQTIVGRKTGGSITALTASEVRTLLALVIGTNVQAWDSDLDTLAANITSFGQSLVDDANAAAARTTLGLGTAATQATGAFDAAGAAAAAQAASQPVDSDLTAIAALTTTSFGRSVLDRADAAALRTLAGLGTAALSASGDFQPVDSDLTAIAALTTTSYGRSVLDRADAAALRTLAGLVLGTDVEAHDSDLTTIAGLTPSNDDFVQRKAGAWANRTVAQVKTDLGVVPPTGSISAAPTGALFETVPRSVLPGSAGEQTLLDGRLHMVAIWLPAGTLVTSISFLSGNVALSAGTHQWFALFDSSRNKLGITADDTSTAWGTSTIKTLNLASPFTTTYSGVHYLGVLVTATTPPKMYGIVANGAGSGVVAPILSGSSNTGLSTTASCPNPANAITGGFQYLYAYVS